MTPDLLSIAANVVTDYGAQCDNPQTCGNCGRPRHGHVYPHLTCHA